MSVTGQKLLAGLWGGPRGRLSLTNSGMLVWKYNLMGRSNAGNLSMSSDGTIILGWGSVHRSSLSSQLNSGTSGVFLNLLGMNNKLANLLNVQRWARGIRLGFTVVVSILST